LWRILYNYHKDGWWIKLIIVMSGADNMVKL
jgi:hypothetical protein